MKRRALYLVVFICIFLSGHTIAQELAITENIKKIDAFFAMEKEILPADEVITLANKVIKQRHYYSANTIAKMFILLSDTADNKGDLGKSIQFAQDGLGVVGINNVLRVNLLLKLAAGYYVEGHFHQVHEFAQEAVKLSRHITSVKSLLVALSYSAMSNALIANNSAAHQELQEVSQLLADNNQFNNHLEVIEILALALLYQQDYNTAKTLYNKAIKLRFESNKIDGIDRSYYYLATTNLKLARLNDAYSGFYQAKQQATKNKLPIRIAFANLGLGQVLLLQKDYAQAIEHLQKAESRLKNESFGAPYLTALINLAKAYSAIDDKPASYIALKRAEQLAQKIEISYDQLDLYTLLADMYSEKNKEQQALEALKKQLQLYKEHYYQKPVTAQGEKDISLDLKNKQIALNVAVQSDLRQSYFKKYQNTKKIIYLLLALLIIFLFTSFYLYLSQRNQRLNKAYDDIERPIDYIAPPPQTKKMYQLNFKKARKFEYVISVGYLSIDNWQELTFSFNKKVVAEVTKTIALLINEYIGEFDQVGLINEGEYLFLSPHQSKESLQAKLNLLSNAINTRFFANLGDFSVKNSYSCQSPSPQDIDPFIFLSRLSESASIETPTFKK
ncbi:tetratricopeptide repeat protein [Thalassotalea profundi]|uniref:tetratricopeptide repeat protein n=1 Tax=Thalassotalea profundi TaxID=2036687 RepID=UPI00167AE811|nr:tetratricopeptide repeat protein [Thalassotalea profundi]